MAITSILSMLNKYKSIFTLNTLKSNVEHSPHKKTYYMPVHTNQVRCIPTRVLLSHVFSSSEDPANEQDYLLLNHWTGWNLFNRKNILLCRKIISHNHLLYCKKLKNKWNDVKVSKDLTFQITLYNARECWVQ